MKQHAFNLYPVANQDDLRFSYRYVEVDGELGAASDDPDLAPKNLNLLAKKVAFGQELPVAIVRGGEKPLLAVASDHPIKRCEYQLTPHVVSLRPQDEIHAVTFSNLDEITRQIALSFLGWELRGHLYRHKDLWRSSPNTCFRKKPVNVDFERNSSVPRALTRLPTFTIGLLKRQVKHLRAADSTRIRRQFSIVMLATRKSATALCRCAN